MTLLQLKYAVTIAEYGSISVAAERIYIAQPSLSKALRELETELGFCIFSRGRRGVKTSPEGEEFLHYARKVLQQSDLLEEKFGHTHKQVKRLSISSQHIAAANSAFVVLLQQYGGDEYKFSICTEETSQVIEDVRTHKSEIGVIALHEENESIMQKLFRDNNLVFTQAFNTPVVAWMANDHPLAKKERLQIEELSCYPIVSYRPGEKDSAFVSEDINFGQQFPKMITVTDASNLEQILSSLQAILLSGDRFIAKSQGCTAVPLHCNRELIVGTIRNRDAVTSTLGSLYLEELESAGKGTARALGADDVRIRIATLEDLPDIMEIYDHARKFMADTGNPFQWGASYPSQDLVIRDIQQNECHVCVRNRRIEAVFALSIGKNKGYDQIYDGQWLNQSDYYGTMHRLASNGSQKGMANYCFNWCSKQCADLRADTHDNNKIMQHLLEKNGFIRCGRVRVEDRSSRIAYQKWAK